MARAAPILRSFKVGFFFCCSWLLVVNHPRGWAGTALFLRHCQLAACPVIALTGVSSGASGDDLMTKRTWGATSDVAQGALSPLKGEAGRPRCCCQDVLKGESDSRRALAAGTWNRLGGACLPCQTGPPASEEARALTWAACGPPCYYLMQRGTSMTPSRWTPRGPASSSRSVCRPTSLQCRAFL
jgi:hypothetical protein